MMEQAPMPWGEATWRARRFIEQAEANGSIPRDAQALRMIYDEACRGTELRQWVVDEGLPESGIDFDTGPTDEPKPASDSDVKAELTEDRRAGSTLSVSPDLPAEVQQAVRKLADDWDRLGVL